MAVHDSGVIPVIHLTDPRQRVVGVSADEVMTDMAWVGETLETDVAQDA